jgi:ATP-dependent Lon protease
VLCHFGAPSLRAVDCCQLFLSPKPLDDLDLHVHVPSGAVQKDGPSAGVAMVASIYSILSHTPLPHNIAMTGEITLTGRVTAVGGIRDKILAAYRYGMRTVILPTANMSDVEDLPQAVKEALTITFVDDVAGAIAVLFKPEDIQSRMRNFDAAPNFRGSKL